ncbi:MAG: hypothetical protein C5B58_05710 [Acidobacteria bacterium]|nr:MAG: hypothetical protein C5B58_05710 [Acidobacteriota bacterium]
MDDDFNGLVHNFPKKTDAKGMSLCAFLPIRLLLFGLIFAGDAKNRQHAVSAAGPPQGFLASV